MAPILQKARKLNPLAEAFMEFFEKNYNVKFVEVKAGNTLQG
jgi:hypothetical protein